MIAMFVDQLRAASLRDLVILDEDSSIAILPFWAKSLQPAAPTVEKLRLMIESATGSSLAELAPSLVAQWATSFLGGAWNG